MPNIIRHELAPFCRTSATLTAHHMELATALQDDASSETILDAVQMQLLRTRQDGCGLTVDIGAAALKCVEGCVLRTQGTFDPLVADKLKVPYRSCAADFDNVT